MAIATFLVLIELGSSMVIFENPDETIFQHAVSPLHTCKTFRQTVNTLPAKISSYVGARVDEDRRDASASMVPGQNNLTKMQWIIPQAQRQRK